MAWCRAALLYLEADDRSTLVGVTRDTAAWLYGLRRSPPSAVQVVVPADRQVIGGKRLRVLRSRDLLHTDLTTQQGIRAVTGARLVRDLAGVSAEPSLRAVVIDLVQRRHTTFGALWEQHDRALFRGRGLLRRVLEQLDVAGSTDSPLEFRVRDGLVAEGIPLDRGQVAVPLRGGARMHLDLGIAAIRFGIEVDSMGAHSQRWQLTTDAVRANALASLEEDWRVLHVTWEILERSWQPFVGEVRDVVAAQCQRHLGIPWPRLSDLVAR
jgi:hypothetical protein